MRFSYEVFDNYVKLVDNQTKAFYLIEDSEENVNELCRILNNLVYENKKFKYGLELLINPIYTKYEYSYNENIYYRTCRQLKEHLLECGFIVSSVSRSNVGDVHYYHVEINLSDDEWEYEKTNDLLMGKALGINGVGLVDFHEVNGKIHEVILIDEKELNEKYLVDGNLVF